ncbi:IgGFc-binding protein-like [Eleutherodactylus coqui]|uniref:IgGFc-binding protein-like n=1 Tax=Eleutherodactylus coqui TaxID=57060 RepID=UPI003461BF64
MDYQAPTAALTVPQGSYVDSYRVHKLNTDLRIPGPPVPCQATSRNGNIVQESPGPLDALQKWRNETVPESTTAKTSLRLKVLCQGCHHDTGLEDAFRRRVLNLRSLETAGEGVGFHIFISRQANDIVMSDDCSQECTCKGAAGMSCRPMSCAKDENCDVYGGVRTCVKKDPCKMKTCHPKETCEVQEQKAVCAPDFTGTCLAWGDPHFGSLDGKNFDFQGTCSYVLTQYAGSDTTLEPYQIIIKNDNRGTTAASYVRKTEVNMYGIKISMEVGEFPLVRVDGELTNLPATVSDGKIKIVRSGLTAVVDTAAGITATFDWNMRTTVTLPSSYYNVLSGLCGNFNQDPNDDHKLPNGTLATSIVDWAASWKVYDRDPFCFDSCPGECPTCEESKKKLYGGEDSCGILFKTDGPFRDCISKVSPDKFFDGCLYDVCMNDGAKVMLCQALESYASTCLSQGIKIYDWRTPVDCPKTCEDPNSHYNACGNACPATCTDKGAPAKCRRPCVETCECNDNLVLSGDRCVPVTSCGCQHNGRYYEPHQSWNNEKCSATCKCDPDRAQVVCQSTRCKNSETCQIVNGVRGCYPKTYSTCISSGDPHYIMFDKKKMDFMGTCIYQLVASISQNSSLPYFIIKVWNEHRGSKAVSFTKEVTMEVHGMTITMSTAHPQQIKVNGRLLNLPCILDSKIICYKSGAHVIVKTDFDLWMSFDGISYATVRLPSTYMGAVNGLCGNNNGDPSDDFNIKDGVEAKSAEEFGNHWKVGEVDGCTTKCPGCPKCSEADKEPYKSDKYCGLLTKPNGPFSQCHDAIDPTTFFEDCLFDACAFKGRQSVVCNTIAAYVSECQRNGSMIKEWRTPSFCELSCPVNSHYKLLGDGCPVTCFGLTTPQTCVKSYTEGCYCNDGFMWSGDECVPMAECGCEYKNMYYKSGQEFFSNDLCQEKCTCGKNGKTSCQANTCGINEECKVVDGILGCHAKEFGQCIAWGNSHYITFDKRYYDMQDTCSYILFSLSTEKVTFIVTVKNEPYGNVAVTKSVTVTIGNHVIHLKRGRTWSIEVNQEQYNVPCRSPTREFWVNQEGNNVIIQTIYGITVLNDGQYFVSVWVPSSYAGQTKGLCGDFNKDTANDFRLPNGTVVTDLSLFAESWTVARDGSTCRGCSGSQCPNCSEAATAEASSPTKCGMIADPKGPFKDCHAKVSPDRYIKSCVFDICNGRGGQENLCASLQAYTALCQEKGVIVQPWRDIAGCPFTCPDNSTYSLCAQTCGYHCYDLMAPTYCTKRCYEGCECDPEYVADGNQCVTMNHCGCVMKNGRYLKINESVQNENCTQVCTCHPEEGLTCQNWTCAEDETCQLLDGVRSCVSTDPCKFKTCRLKETCKVQDDNAECVPDYTGQCLAQGDSRFQNFDGKAYIFQGTCSYVFAEYSGSDPTLERFRVIIKCENRGNQNNSFVRRMEISIYNTTISAEVGEFPKVKLNGEEANLPINLFEGKLTAKRSGLKCIIETKSVTATFDWNWDATVTVSSSYYNAMSGLCGNFNQDPNDDHKLPNGTLATSIVDWAALWKVYDRDPFCFDSCPGECPTCEESKKKLYGGDDYCGILFKTDGPFRDCISKVSPNEFFDGCLYNSCMNNGESDTLCKTLETYTSTCQSKGLKIYEWRTSLNCSKVCKDKNSHYNVCGNACPASCFDRNAPAKCTKPCVETCECNKDMVLSGGKCVSISNCGCQYKGRDYEPNESWTNEKCTEICKCDPILGMVKCQEMSCRDGEMCKVVNGRHGCHPSYYSTCVVSGTSHYQTFDGRMFTYMSSCEHHLAKKISNDSSLADFTITAVNDRLGNKAVSFTVHNTTIIMSKQHPQQIQVDGHLTELPYYLSNEGRNLISAYSSGNKVVVKTDHELNVMRDGWNNVLVVMPSTYRGAINGLCGNNNGDPSDDFTTADNRILESAEEFGLHWKVGDVEGCTEGCSDCPKCSEADKEPYKNDKYCGLLIKSDGPFSQCHQAIDPIPFFNNCLADACAYKGHQSRVCDSISIYVSECQRNGSQVKEWRTPSFCEWNCPSNSHYELTGNGCPSTCYERTSPLVCEKTPTEACYCNNGFIRSGQDCVPPAECGCVFGNTYYKLGQEFFLDGLCQKKCICGNHSITTCDANTCGINEECKVVDGIRACHAKELGQCIAWGDQHYITFDQYYYDMQGTCSYILVKLETDKITFVVIVENEPYGNVAVTKSVKVIIADHIIHLKRGRSWSIEVNREQYNVPYRSPTGECWVNQEGNNVIIQSIHGFTMLFNGLYYLSVWVPSSYAGLTEGLCGNFNKDPSDDIRLPNSTIVTDMSLFAESWTVARDGSTCRGCSGSQCPTCSEAATAEANSPTKCGIIADPQGPFKDCHVLVPPEIYVKSCVFDACAGSSTQGNLCVSLQAYTALCQEKGANIKPWRTITNCPQSCPANSHYEVCVKTCKSTCNTLLVGTTCSDKCYEGCECDIEYMLDGEKCVTADKCGCNLRGRYMKNGETVVTEDCVQRCKCQSGSLSCVNLGCAKNEICQVREGVRSCQPLASQCILRANRNFITFDGVSGQFPMDGSYVMSSSCSEDAEVQFMVVIGTKKCSKSTDGIAVQIFTTQGLISVNGQQIWINGWELEASRDLGNGSVKIQTSQSETTIELYNEITVKFTKSGDIQITAKEKLSGEICGPCGNFNGDYIDDLRLKTGEVSSDISFTIRSWIAKHLSPCLV